MTILPPKSDIVFKMLFGTEQSKDILADFLKSVLDLKDEECEVIEIIDPHSTPKYPDGKLSILDVKLRIADKIIDIEIQLVSVTGIRSRITYYLSNMLSEQLSGGDEYKDLKRAVCIVIVDFPLVYESENFHTVFRLLEKDEHFPFNDLLEINVLDMTKIPPNGKSNLVNWLKFIKAERQEEFEMVSSVNPIINNAYARLVQLSESESNRMIYEARVKQQRDELSRINGARREGIAEGMAKGMERGIEQGIEQGQARLIKVMLANGTDIKTVSRITGINQIEIAKNLQ
jgi:predicted transposase/invertase (TIGR01784 family)